MVCIYHNNNQTSQLSLHLSQLQQHLPAKSAFIIIITKPANSVLPNLSAQSVFIIIKTKPPSLVCIYHN